MRGSKSIVTGIISLYGAHYSLEKYETLVFHRKPEQIFRKFGSLKEFPNQQCFTLTQPAD